MCDPVVQLEASFLTHRRKNSRLDNNTACPGNPFHLRRNPDEYRKCVHFMGFDIPPIFLLIFSFNMLAKKTPIPIMALRF
jgi:hypothetical protein